MRPYRSMLFVPANDPKKVAKALASAADCVILDLEDAVALSAKQAARSAVREILRDRGEREVYVRVNSFDTPFLYEDLTAVVPACPTGIMLPKAESVDQLKCVDWLIGQLERQVDMVRGVIGLVTLVETACGIERAAEISGGSERIKCLAFGAVDYTLDIGTKLSADGLELLHARSRVVVASRLGGREKPIDTVYPNFRDMAGLRVESELAKGLGYQGKMIIHPDQIDIVHQVFSPSAEELAYAARVVAAFEEAEKNGLAAIHLDGKMIDYPVMLRARQLLGVADLP